MLSALDALRLRTVSETRVHQDLTLVDDLEAGSAVRACSAAHQDVVGLFTGGGDWVLVETDGCRRVLGGSTSVWRQATPELLAALR